MATDEKVEGETVEGIIRVLHRLPDRTRNQRARRAEIEAAIHAAFEAEAGLRAVAEWQGRSWDCPEFEQPEGWEEIREHVCRGYAEDHEDAQFVCEQTDEQCRKCWFKYWVLRAKQSEARTAGDSHQR